MLQVSLSVTMNVQLAQLSHSARKRKFWAFIFPPRDVEQASPSLGAHLAFPYLPAKYASGFRSDILLFIQQILSFLKERGYTRAMVIAKWFNRRHRLGG